MVHVALLLRLAADHDGRLRRAERVVVDLDGRAGDVRAVLAVAAAVHVEAVAQRRAQFDVVAGHVTAAGLPVPAIEWRFQSNRLHSISDEAASCETP